MADQRITRQQIIDQLKVAMQDLPFVRAMWLGGSDATGRTDEWSDIDMYLIVEDTEVETTFSRVSSSLEALSPIKLVYRLPSPTWHGHEQWFIMLEDADPFAQLDLVIMVKSNPDRFLEVERHGEAMILFDKDELTEPPPLNRGKHWARLRKRLQTLRAKFELGQPAVTRAVLREAGAEAMVCYQNLSLRPLVELLRMRHCPERFDYGIRYIDRDLPHELRQTIEQLAYPPSCEAIEQYRAEVEALYRENIEDLDRGIWSVE
jgi:predicted nucleotidyltransferase